MKRPFFAIAAGFVLGEVMALQMEMAGMKAETGAAALWAAGCLAAAGFILIRRKKICRGRGKLLPFCVAFFAWAAGALWAGERISSLEAQEQWVKEKQEEGVREFWGKIKRMEETGTGWEIWLGDVRQKGNTASPLETPLETGLPVLLAVQVQEMRPEDLEGFFVGQTVLVQGEIQGLEPARNPGEFDYRLYQLSRGISGQIGWARVQAAGKEEERHPYADFLARLRRKWGYLLREMCREPEAGLFCSVLLGDKKTLDPEIRSLYQQNGIAHLLAISGLHLSILGMGFYRSIRRAGLSPIPCACAACGAVLSYGLLIGASGSTKRAIIMMICAFGADCAGRTYDSLSALGLAAVMVSAAEPYQLLQSGFQLSFGAVLGIGWIGAELTEEWRQWKEERRMRKGVGTGGKKKGRRKRCVQSLAAAAVGGLITSLAVQVVTAPVIAFHFFRFPVYGIFLNILVIPLMAYAFYSGILGLALGNIFLPAGKIALYMGCWIFGLYEYLCRGMERIPGSSFLTGRPESWQICLYYGVLLGIWMCWKSCRKKKQSKNQSSQEPERRLFWALPAAMAAIGFFGPLALKTPAPRNLSAVFLDVGQGDGIVLQEGKTAILIDGGSSDKKSLGRQRLLPFLESRGISAIDCSIVTHGDSDHISGLIYLLEEGIPIRRLILPEAGKGQESYERLEKLASKNGASVCYFSRGGKIRIKGAEPFAMTCIYPDKASPAFGGEETNRHSLVFLVEYGNFRMLLTGDMEGEDEKRLAGWEGLEGLGPVHVLKAAHHGSKTSSTWPFLEKTAPKYAVLSYGKGNAYGHPHGETIERLEKTGAQIFQTGEQGAVLIWTDGDKMEIKGYLE